MDRIFKMLYYYKSIIFVMIFSFTTGNLAQAEQFHCEIQKATSSLPFEMTYDDYKKYDMKFKVETSDTEIFFFNLWPSRELITLDIDTNGSIALVGSGITSKFVLDKKTGKFGLAFLAPPIPRMLSGYCS
jgi:hypothetical protein